MTRLQDLYDIGGQSPWLDNLRRDWITEASWPSWIDRGVRGITSNPSIFQKAIEGNADYDDQFRALVKDHTVDDTYWDLAITDIRDALAILRPVYDESDGVDGYVSVEVAPSLARDTDGTVASRPHLHDAIDAAQPVRQDPSHRRGRARHPDHMIGEGRSINVTLLFSLDRYGEVIEAYLSGLEALVAAPAGEAELAQSASVASFFVSRVDTEVDHRLEQIGADEAPASGPAGQGGGGQRQAGLPALPPTASAGPRWEALRRPRGPRAASAVGVDVDQEPGLPRHALHRRAHRPDTVNTIPDATLDAFEDHGTLARTVDADSTRPRPTSRRWPRRASTSTTSSSARGRGRARVHQVVRRADRQSCRPRPRRSGPECTERSSSPTTCPASSPRVVACQCVREPRQRRLLARPVRLATPCPRLLRRAAWPRTARRRRSTGGRSTSTGATSGASRSTIPSRTTAWPARRCSSGWARPTPMPTRGAATRGADYQRTIADLRGRARPLRPRAPRPRARRPHRLALPRLGRARRRSRPAGGHERRSARDATRTAA